MFVCKNVDVDGTLLQTLFLFITVLELKKIINL